MNEIKMHFLLYEREISVPCVTILGAKVQFTFIVSLYIHECSWLQFFARRTASGVPLSGLAMKRCKDIAGQGRSSLLSDRTRIKCYKLNCNIKTRDDPEII